MRSLKQRFSVIKDVRGCGLLSAMEFGSDISQPVVTACLERGLLVNRLKPNALRFMPPLVITKKDVDEALSILEESLSVIGN